MNAFRLQLPHTQLFIFLRLFTDLSYVSFLQREMEQLGRETEFIFWRTVNLDAGDNRLKYYTSAEFISVK